MVILTCICFLIGQRDLTPPFVDDGLLEVVGFRDAWHGLVLLAPKGHGTRLAQVRNKLWLLQTFVPICTLTNEKFCFYL